MKPQKSRPQMSGRKNVLAGQLIPSAISRHYNPGHHYCNREYDEAHEAEKRSQLWKGNVIKQAIITAQSIRELRTHHNAETIARFLDGGIVFGHNVEAVNRREFADIRAFMTQLLFFNYCNF
uniref:Uncharacterized protein n=1 Tax=Panagrolaimus sp. PS1159 TaxID=55785 RepID=A0AC35GVD3_9BILA